MLNDFEITESRMNGEGPSSPQSGDSAVASSSLSAGLPTNITPSITLIPIKQVCTITLLCYIPFTKN